MPTPTAPASADPRSLQARRIDSVHARGSSRPAPADREPGWEHRARAITSPSWPTAIAFVADVPRSMPMKTLILEPPVP